MNNKSRIALMGAAAVASATVAQAAGTKKTSGARPNIVLIMMDDMGYSDIECYGGLIPTPNINRLASSGVRYTQFYNTARSCPTRASLLTGLYPHQAGIGEMSEDPGSKVMPEDDSDGYMAALNRHCVTMAEVLGDAGYHTYMVGKWHVGMHGMEKWPLQRGFDRFYGILAGATSYLAPHDGRGLYLDNTKLPVPEPPYYTTDAFTDKAIEFLGTRKDDDPFFLYVAYNAPHWPLHAKQEDIDKFKGKFDAGWQAIQEQKRQRMIDLGIVKPEWGVAEWENRNWDELSDKEKQNSSLRMSVYAAQIYCVDYNVGKLLDYLEETGQRDNTLIIFLSDNGACAEPYSETGFGTVNDINNPDSWVAPSYGKPWAQVSNTPYRKYKVRAYEGGISTPLILSWPEKYAKYDGTWRNNVGFLPDIMATFVDVSGATYPAVYHNGNEIYPMEGSSLCPTVKNPKKSIHDYIYGEHFDNRYVRWKNWKAVYDEKGKVWELYDIENDRTERHNLAAEKPEILADLTAHWKEWADTHHVYPKRPKKK